MGQGIALIRRRHRFLGRERESDIGVQPERQNVAVRIRKKLVGVGEVSAKPVAGVAKHEVGIDSRIHRAPFPDFCSVVAPLFFSPCSGALSAIFALIPLIRSS